MRYVIGFLLVTFCGFRAFADEDYVPLAVGNHWTMTVTSTTSKGQVANGTYHEEAAGTVKKGGHRYFAMEQWVKWNLPNQKIADVKSAKHITLVRKTTTAYYSTEKTKKGLVEGVIYRLPLKSGASWDVNWPSRRRKITVLGKESVKVSGQTYKDCYHVRIAYQNGTLKNIWLAPGIGRVLVKDVFPDGQKISFALTQFKAGK